MSSRKTFIKQGVKTLLGCLAVALATGSIALATRIGTTLGKYPQPQASLILDGSDYRVYQAAVFVNQHPHLPVWVSGNCANRPAVQTAFYIFSSVQQTAYDLRATDTVTHFTTLVDDLIAQDIHHVYLLTSDYHMNRSLVNATLIFGSRGIVVTPVSLPSKDRPTAVSYREQLIELGPKSVRDGVRSLLWIATGRTGAGLNPNVGHLPGGASCLSQLRIHAE